MSNYPLIHYKFDGNVSNYGSGGALYDSEENGTITFDSINKMSGISAVVCPDITLLGANVPKVTFNTGTNGFTMSFWVRNNNDGTVSSANNAIYTSKVGNTADSGASIGISTDIWETNSTTFYTFSKGSHIANTKPNTWDGNFHHYVITSSGSAATGSVYIDNVLITSTIMNVSNNVNQTIWIGGMFWGVSVSQGDNGLNGTMDDFKLYQHETDANFVEYLYKIGNGDSLIGLIGSPSAGTLLHAGATVSQLVAAGFSVTQLVAAGFSVTQLLTAGASITELVEAGLIPEVVFSTNSLTVDNSTIYPVYFVLPAGTEMSELTVTNFIGTGTITYTLSATGATDITGTVTASGTNLLSGNVLVATVDTTYVLSLTADAAITYTIVGTKSVDYGAPWGSSIAVDIINSGAAANYGYSVSISENYAIVGAYLDNNDLNGGSSLKSGAAYIYEKDGAGTWTQKAYIKPSQNNADVYFGYSVAISGNYAAIGAYREGTTQPLSGAMYIIERDTNGDWGTPNVGSISSIRNETTMLKADVPGDGDYVGNTVAISGNYAITGAYNEDSNSITNTANNDAATSGAAYIFERDGAGSWTQTAYLKSGNIDIGDMFGTNVTISGNYAAVGAQLEDSSSITIPDNNNENSGAVYIFERDGAGNWAQQAYLKAGDTGEIGQHYKFGRAVAIDGNYAIIGAYTSIDVSGTTESGTGSVYIFERDGTGSWTQKSFMIAGNADIGDFFGWSVAISGNYAAVGAYKEASNSASDPADNTLPSGAVYVFGRDVVGNWSELNMLKQNTIINSRLGYTVAISGHNIISGGYTNEMVSIFAGVAGSPPLTFATNTLTIENSINATDTDQVSFVLPAGTEMSELSVTGFIGTGTIMYTLSTTGATDITGTFTASGTNLLSGNALIATVDTTYILTMTADAAITYTIVGTKSVDLGIKPYGTPDWTTATEQIFGADVVIVGGLFGRDVGISGNYMITTADGSDTAYIFEKNILGVWSQLLLLQPTTVTSGDEFGSGAAIEGNYACVGAKLETGIGSAYVFELNAGTWTEKQRIQPTSILTSGANFGISMSISGDYLAIGSRKNIHYGSQGSVHIYKRDGSGTWNEFDVVIPVYDNNGTWADMSSGNQGFGIRLVIQGDDLYVGASGSNEVFVFKLNSSSTGFEPQQIITRTDTTDNDTFGNIDADGDHMIVGAYNGNTEAAFIYERNSSGVWTNEVRLNHSTPSSTNNFGYAVSINGNYAIVTAYGTSTNAGAAFIYEKQSGGWTKIKDIVPPGGSVSYLGVSVFIDNDYALVGAYKGASNGVEGGLVYSYKATLPIIPTPLTFATNTLTIENSINATDIDPVSFVLPAGYEMGNLTVTNFSGTGTITYTLSATGATDITGTVTASGTNLLSGNVLVATVDTTYILTLTADAAITYTIVGTKTLDVGVIVTTYSDWGTEVIGQTYRTENHTSTVIDVASQYGTSTAVFGDYAVIGSPAELIDGSKGAVYIFQRVSGSWTLLKRIIATGLNANSGYFGHTVAINENYIVVGAIYQDSGGAAYIFERDPTTGWPDTETVMLKPVTEISSARFGESVAINGNYIVVGTLAGGSGINTAGTAYIFELSGGSWGNEVSGQLYRTETKMIYPLSRTSYDRFGISVAINGNYIIIGAKQEDSNIVTDPTDGNAGSSGAAYLFERDTVTGLWPDTETKYFKASTPVVNGYFGAAVSMTEDYIVVGESGRSGGGAAYIFERDSTTGWPDTPTQQITAGDVDAVEFGKAVEIYGNKIVVGAKGTLSSTGSAYIFERDSTTGWPATSTTKVIASNGDSGDEFGWSVAISENYAMSGCRLGNKAYIFEQQVIITVTPTPVAFSNNILTIENSISTTDTDVVSFVLPSGTNLGGLNVTYFEGTGTVTYTLSTSGATDISGSFTASGIDILSGIPLFAKTADTTYVLTLTADADITYTITGTSAVTNLYTTGYSIRQLLLGGFTQQELLDAGVWNIDPSANRLNQTYIDGFADISGGTINIRNNLQMGTGDADLNRMTFTQPYTYDADMSLNSRLVVVGDVSMGDVSFNVMSDISINGTLSVGSYKAGSIAVAAFDQGDTSGYNTANSITTVTADISYNKKIEFNGDISLNIQVGVDMNEPNVFASTDKKTTSGKRWQDIEISSTGQYQIAVVGGGNYTSQWYTTTIDYGNVWISTDYGENWTEQTGDNQVSSAVQQWISAMISGDGSIMMVKGRGNLLYRSTNYGEDWTQNNYNYNDNTNYGTSGTGINGIPMKMATDGNTLFTYFNNGGTGQQPNNRFIKSINGGSNWTTSATPDTTDNQIGAINASKSGQYVILTYIDNSTHALYSADYGGTFIKLSNVSAVGGNSWYSTHSNVACISNTGKICMNRGSTLYNIDVTTGTITGTSPTQVNDALSTPSTRGSGSGNFDWKYIMNSSTDGKYVMLSGGRGFWLLFSTDYGVTFNAMDSNSPFATTAINTNEIWGCRFSDDNKYIAVAQNNNFIYVKHTESFEPNPNSITYFGPNTTLKINNAIQFPDSTTMGSSNKEANGTTFKASTFNNMTVIGDFSSPSAVVTTSDYRIKTDVQTLDETHVLDNLRPVKYLQTQTQRQDIGFLAHELQEHYPELVEGEKDGDKMQAINYSGLLPILINEVQQIKKQIAETRAHLNV